MKLEPYDSTIASLEKQLERLNKKKRTAKNMEAIVQIKFNLSRWKEAQEEALKEIKLINKIK